MEFLNTILDNTNIKYIIIIAIILYISTVNPPINSMVNSFYNNILGKILLLLLIIYYSDGKKVENIYCIPEKLLNHAKIKTNILFVGLGKTFQIWEPKNFEKFKILARKKAYQNRSNLKWENKQKGELS